MINFRCKPFYELNVHELYAIMSLRQEVFVVEQNCPYLDADGKDFNSSHLMGFDDDGKLVAYCRLMPRGLTYEHHACIGRVVSSPSARGTGAGRSLMRMAMDEMEQRFPGVTVKIGAQKYLRKFYEDFGFVVTGEEYLEDGIPHYPMIR